MTSSPDIESWIEKIPTALEKQIERPDESAIIDIDIRHLAHQASGKKYFVEATFVSGKISLHAESENENLPSAIEAVRDEIVTVFVSNKKRRERFIRKGGRAIKDFVKGFYGKKNR